MTTTMPAMKRTIDALVRAGLRERVKVMVGGAPVSQAFADEIGADGYARDSTAAVVKAKGLVGSRRRPREGARVGRDRARGRRRAARGWRALTADACSRRGCEPGGAGAGGR